jgi:hypothetical protein
MTTNARQVGNTAGLSRMERLMRCVQSRHIEGKRIVKLGMAAAPDGRGGVYHQWTITLDDGSQLKPIVEETNVGEYGVALIRSNATTRTRRPGRSAGTKNP